VNNFCYQPNRDWRESFTKGARKPLAYDLPEKGSKPHQGSSGGVHNPEGGLKKKNGILLKRGPSTIKNHLQVELARSNKS